MKYLINQGFDTNKLKIQLSRKGGIAIFFFILLSKQKNSHQLLMMTIFQKCVL